MGGRRIFESNGASDLFQTFDSVQAENVEQETRTLLDEDH